MGKATLWLKEDYIKKDGTAQLYLRYFHHKKYSFIDLKIYINPADFDKKTFKIFKSEQSKENNLLIQEAIGRAAEIILRYKVLKKDLSHELFEKEFKNPEVFQDFYAFMEDQIRQRAGEIGNLSIRQHLSILNKLKTFKKELMFSELTEDFIRGYYKFEKIKLKNCEATCACSIKVVKTYVNMALKFGLLHNNPFKYYKSKKVKSFPTFLTISERDDLIDLYSRQFLPESHQKVLRWFLFACYTGLRISDFKDLNHECIKNNIITIRPIKTQNIDNRTISIPLSKTALMLIKDENPHRIKGLVFETFSEARINKFLKEIMTVAKIDKNISFKAARHTFATIFLQKSKKGNAIVLLQRLLGHSKLETTMIYLHVITDELEEAIEMFD